MFLWDMKNCPVENSTLWVKGMGKEANNELLGGGRRTE
jgi:hypothetical protein